MPLQQTSGNVTADAYGGGAAAVPNYIEDVFSTYLYTGQGSATPTTINNGIDLAGKGGLVWVKNRNNTQSHYFWDTARGTPWAIYSNTTDAQQNADLNSFNNNGFTVGSYSNSNTFTYASWTLRKQPKFFDVVTYTGNGANRTIAHSLGSTPGCIMVKRTDTTGNWQVYHNSLTSAAYSIQLNLTNAQVSATTVWNSTAPTSSVFSVGTDATVNASGGTYVAYLFAHNAGGFGLTGTDNVISCGSFTADGSGNATVSLGYEAQWLLTKSSSDSTSGWLMFDNMRGWYVSTAADPFLYANTSDAENTSYNLGNPTATGFQITGFIPGTTYIYIAIRRGPMKVPTDATTVFKPITANAATGTVQTTNFVIDSQWKAQRAGSSLIAAVDDRLRGVSTTTTSSGNYLITSSDGRESSGFATTQAWNNIGFQIASIYNSTSTVFWNFKRAPGFFDEVCYTGTGGGTTFNHNLNVVPEIIFVKNRLSAGNSWIVYVNSIGNTSGLLLDQASPKLSSSSTYWNSTNPTSSVFSVGTNVLTNNSGDSYIAYLFASCPSVSKVGSYTGNGTTQTINCGFAGGARFVLIKRTDSTGDWYVYDTARGMTTLTDPYLLLNSVAAESATLGSVTTVTTGFAVNASILAAINTNAATYIFLAIA